MAKIDPRTLPLSAGVDYDRRVNETPLHPPIPQVMATPSMMFNVWFPASVMLPPQAPDFGTAPRHKRRVYLTDRGLFVYAKPDVVEWWAEVDYEKTSKPPTPYAARQSGVFIQTSVGQVVISPDTGCGCTHPLKRWSPPWANRVGSWDEYVSAREGR